MPNSIGRTRSFAAAQDSWRRIILENALDALVGFDSGERVIDWNRQAEITFGWTREQAIGRKISELIVFPGAGEGLAESVASRLSGPVANRPIVVEAIDKRSNRFPAEIIVIPIMIEGERVFYAFIRDLTEKHEQQAKAREHERARRSLESLFQILFEQAPFSTQLFRPSGRTIRVNRAWQELWNVSDETVRNYVLKEYSVLADPQLKTKGILPYLERALSGVPVETPAILYDPNEMGLEGRARWVKGYVYPVRGPDKKVEYFVLIHEDVTDQIESAEDQRFLSDLYVEFTGGSDTGDMISRTTRSLSGRLGAARCWLREAGSDQGPRGEAAPGESRFVVPVHREGGVVAELGVAAPGSRVWEEREKDLVRSVAEGLWSAVERARLLQRAQEAIRARDEFISICSHELRTPVTSLKLQLEMAERQARRGDPSVYEKSKVERRMVLALRQLDRMTQLIDEMLDVSRVARGKMRLERVSVDIGRLVREVLDRFSEQFGILRIPVEARIAPEPLIVKGDRYRIDQVVTNLITNAIKYGSGSPVSVRVRSGDSMAIIEVEDHGIGISKENIERIFNRFERAVSATHYGGLGLGLYISRQIAEAHGGKIRVESDPVRGTVFGVELPLAR